jgi:TPR repeat protein
MLTGTEMVLGDKDMAFDMSSTETVDITAARLVDVSEPNMFELGLSYSTGVGADVDYVEAHKWFNIAALRGDGEAKQRRQELTAMMTQSQVSAAQRAAREWLMRASN